MARKRYEEEPESQERWLVSYADFITLLFAFFVVMYAVSSINDGKVKVASNALTTAFGRLPAAAPPVRDRLAPELPLLPRQSIYRSRLNDNAIRREKEQLTTIARDLLTALAPLASQGKVKVTQGARGITVEINASVLFAPGDAKLSAPSTEALAAVAQVLKDDLHAIQVEGHTDNVPIRNALYPSNWELSSVRASSVVRLFIDNGVAPVRLTAIGHGANRPVESNDTPEGRLRNRRVQLMIMSNLPDVQREVEIGSGSR
ncbi:flagellar motor protein MotD [Noviherbaspirillum soli]|uniref:flagellar motor protein MotD n=1 Tax=Noviherbaspirillum soli TaxID=1064518 RepID=UPI00188B96B9|nr:flagellar motor protein MotD [Noviherbaspirillum soli]